MKRIIFLLFTTLCAFNIEAQNLRIIEGSVQDYRGNTIANATINIFGTDKLFKCDENGNFSIEVPIQTFALTASAEGYSPKYLEVDGTYMLFILRPKTQKEIAWEQQQVQLAKQKKIEAQDKVKKKQPIVQKEAKAQVGEQAKKTINSPSLIQSCIETNISKLKKWQIEEVRTTYTALGDLYLNKSGEDNLKRAFLCYYLGAKKNEPEAIYILATYYETGYYQDNFAIHRDLKLALSFYEKAAEMSVTAAKEKAESLRKQQ